MQVTDTHQGAGGAPVDSGLACLVMLARFHNVAASAEQLAHEYAPDGRRPLGRAELLMAARGLGLKARSVHSALERLAHVPLQWLSTRVHGRPASCIEAKNPLPRTQTR